MSASIDYASLMHRAMRGLVRNVLSDVARTGLPGEHHFYITFDTRHPRVMLADWLRERYPDEMTIVLQHWFEGLEVDERGFGVTLNFGDSPEQLYIPFEAIRTFVDPSVEFGLRFETGAEEEAESELAVVGENDTDADGPPEVEKHDAEVVSLDKFRK